MSRPIFVFLSMIIGALMSAMLGTSCATTDDPSPHTEKVRKQNTHMEIMQRHRRRNRG